MYELLLLVTVSLDTAVDLTDRRTTRGSNAYSLTLWTGIVQSLLIFPAIGLVGFMSAEQLMLSAVVAAIAVVGRMRWYSALATDDDLSRLAPFRRVSSVFVLILAVALLGEPLSLQQGLGAVLIIGGALLVTLDRPRDSLRAFIHDNRAARLVLVFAFSSACISVTYRYLLTSGVSVWTSYFYMRLFQFLALLAIGFHRGPAEMSHAMISNVRLFVFCRCVQTASAMCYLVAIKNIPLTSAQPIVAMAPFIMLAAESFMARRVSPAAAAGRERRVALLRIAAFIAAAGGIVLLERPTP